MHLQLSVLAALLVALTAASAYHFSTEILQVSRVFLQELPAEQPGLEGKAETPAVQISSKLECNTGNRCVTRVLNARLQRKPNPDNSSLLTTVCRVVCLRKSKQQQQANLTQGQAPCSKR